MPFKSAKQRRLFQMCRTAKGRKKSKKKCPSAKTIRAFLRHG